MHDDPGSLSPIRHSPMLWFTIACIVFLVFPASLLAIGPNASSSEAARFLDIMPIPMLLFLTLLIGCSAYFSASEVAFFSLHSIQLRALSNTKKITAQSIVKLLLHPGKLLITILMGNMVVNVLISVLLPTRMHAVFTQIYHMPALPADILTVIASTFLLVFFGEIMPKVIAVRFSESYAKAAVLPMLLLDKALNPIRISVIAFTDFIFRVTRFNDIKAAPFITDEEFISVLSESEAQGVIEEEEGQMIQGILESGDAKIREILVPRPDIIAIEKTATIQTALQQFGEHGFSRMPVYQDNLDNIVGVLFAKDLLPQVFNGELEHSITAIIRSINFVPQTMTIQAFVRDAQYKRMHIAIVADEFGGTEGIVTLEDAIEEIVGDIQDSSDVPELPKLTKLSDSAFRAHGDLPLHELFTTLGIDPQDDTHETIAAYFITHTQKIPEKGDLFEHNELLFEVEHVDGKRVTSFHIEVRDHTTQKDSA